MSSQIPQIQTQYNPGSASTITQGQAPAGNEDLSGFYQELLRRKMAVSRQPPPQAQEQQAPMRMQPSQQEVQQEAPRMSPQDWQLDQAQKRHALLTIQAREQGPPMKGVHGPGMIGSAGGMDTMDVNSMNAIQREIFLPQSSQQINTPANAAAAAGTRDDEARWSDQMAGDRARTKGQYGSDLGGEVQQNAIRAIPPPGATPQGTAPMLTPGNAAAPPRQLTPEERARQAQTNAQYGR